MKFFITGTDTEIGKTLIASWLCLQAEYKYFKPIQTGSEVDSDTEFVCEISGVQTYPESYLFKKPLSPHLAASLESSKIDINNIILPDTENLIVEGAGGALVPINEKILMVDLIKHLGLPAIIVARSTLGTINHTLMTIEALRSRGVEICGVILNGPENVENARSIELYGKVKILANFPKLDLVNREVLSAMKLTKNLSNILGVNEFS
jgi:dethiobiotin synthase